MTTRSLPRTDGHVLFIYALYSMASDEAAAAAPAAYVEGGGQRRQERLTPEKESPMHVPPIGSRSGEYPLSIAFLYIPGVTKAAGSDFETQGTYHHPKPPPP